MEQFIEVITGYPTMVFTVALVFVALFWLLSILGLVDLEMGLSTDVEIEADHDAGEFGIISGFLSYFGLNGIPVTVVISVLVLVSWLLSYFAGAYLINPLPFDWLRYVLGSLVIIGCVFVAAPITGMSLRPTRHLFAGERARTKASFVGAKGVVTTLTVDKNFGQATVDDGGAGLLVDVRCDVPNTLTKGSEVALLSYDESAGCYTVMADEDFMKL